MGMRHSGTPQSVGQLCYGGSKRSNHLEKAKVGSVTVEKKLSRPAVTYSLLQVVGIRLIG